MEPTRKDNHAAVYTDSSNRAVVAVVNPVVLALLGGCILVLVGLFFLLTEAGPAERNLSTVAIVGGCAGLIGAWQVYQRPKLATGLMIFAGMVGVPLVIPALLLWIAAKMVFGATSSDPDLRKAWRRRFIVAIGVGIALVAIGFVGVNANRSGSEVWLIASWCVALGVVGVFVSLVGLGIVADSPKLKRTVTALWIVALAGLGIVMLGLLIVGLGMSAGAQ
jgi:hypothetical protein